MTAAKTEACARPSRCENCTKVLEQVTESSWMCVPCRINVYWFA